jgi:hypothetical protein
MKFKDAHALLTEVILPSVRPDIKIEDLAALMHLMGIPTNTPYRGEIGPEGAAFADQVNIEFGPNDWCPVLVYADEGTSRAFAVFPVGAEEEHALVELAGDPAEHPEIAYLEKTPVWLVLLYRPEAADDPEGEHGKDPFDGVEVHAICKTSELADVLVNSEKDAHEGWHFSIEQFRTELIS